MPHRSTPTRAVLSCAFGVVVALVVVRWASIILAVVSGWTVVAITYSALTWHLIRWMSAEQVRRHAIGTEPGRRSSHVVLILTGLGSLVGVGVLLAAGSGRGSAVPLEALVGAASVAASWVMVHIIYTIRYAGVYYADPDAKAVDFNSDEDPDYQDFAYLAFTLGMTYQVSDTDLRTKAIRRTVLRHTLLSYLLGAGVIASTINLVVQLASSNVGGGGQG